MKFHRQSYRQSWHNSHLKYLFLLLMCHGCIAPRSNIQSGKVTPKGDLTLGYDITVNASLNTMELASRQVIKEYESVTNKDDREYDRDVLNEYSNLVLAQALDPIGSSNQLYARYGLLDSLDVGLAYGSAGFIVDSAYQFFHHQKSSVDASIGLQYSAQSFELPSVAGDLQDILGFDFSRDDILLRTTISLPFGPDEKYGAFGFGLAMNYTSLSYGFRPEEVKYIDSGEVAYLGQVPTDSQSFLSYGGFINLKVGYEYAYLVSSLSLYKQNYGTYALPDNQKSQNFSGYTLVPSIGVQGTFGVYNP